MRMQANFLLNDATGFAASPHSLKQETRATGPLASQSADNRRVGHCLDQGCTECHCAGGAVMKHPLEERAED